MTPMEPAAGEELERRLARYARVRLEPSQAATRRARAAAMEQAWRQRLDAPASVVAGPSPILARRRGLFAAWSSRRIAASLSAAVLAGLLVGSSAFAASRAGGPLYSARIALEDISLPVEANARAEAEIARAEARLTEVVDAVARHDDAALAAASEAYEVAAERLAGIDGAASTRAIEALTFHRTVLESVLAAAPEAAGAGLTTAVSASSAALDRLTSAGSPGAPGDAGDPTDHPGASARPDNTPRADPSGKPERTARPDPTQKPAKSPKPERTTRPTPPVSPDPGNPSPQP